MKTFYYCAACGINWASLIKTTDEGENETCEVCPKCRDDTWLVANKKLPAYIMSPFSDKIIDFQTKQDMKGPKLTPKEREIFDLLKMTPGGILRQHINPSNIVCYRLLDSSKN